jgi:hypothetical protein
LVAAIGKPEEAATLASVKQRVIALTSRHPLPYHA